jgi:hypothetical protein
MANVVVSAIATFNGKALTKGQKQIKSFEKSVKHLGRTLGISLGAAAIVNFSKKAIDAFVKDEAAAKSLETQLKNTGYAFSAPDVELYIANLQKMYGVLDDQLRPAFQTLLTASGSITKSQKALAVALDVSAATGKSVEEVSAAMAKGFSGQTTALGRLGAGIDKTTLASGDMNKILDELSTKFSGQALARLGTYAGKMDQLKVATQNASEIIGKDLLDSLSAFSKDDSLSGFDDLLSGLATKLASLDKAVFGFVAKIIGVKKQTVNFSYSLGAGAGTEIAKAKEAAIIKKTNAARALELEALNKKTAVDALKDKFDIERIGLTVALNSATDDETKLRIKAQLAILDNNEALAKKYLAEMNASEAVKKLADDANKAGTLLVDGAAAAFARLALYNPVNMSPGQGGGYTSGGGGISTGAAILPTGVKTNADNSLFNQPADPQGSNYNITLELAPNAGEFGQLVYNSFLLNQKNGNVQNYAGGNF